MLAIALVMNIIWHYYGTDATFNMFYISPYYPCTLPLLNIIYDSVPYVIFLILYIIGFVLAASAILGIAILFDKIEKAIHKRKLSAEDVVVEKILEIAKDDLK